MGAQHSAWCHILPFFSQAAPCHPSWLRPTLSLLFTQSWELGWPQAWSKAFLQALSLSPASVGPGGEQIHGVAPSSPAQVETMANTPCPWAVSGLTKVIRHPAQRPRLARLRRAEPPGAPVLACKRTQPPASPAQKPSSRQSFGSCQNSADPQRT